MAEINYWQGLINLFCSALGIILPGFVGTWWVRGKIEDIKRHGEKIHALEVENKSLKDTVTQLNTNFSELKGGIDRDREHYSGFVKAKSPLSLTERGLKVLEESGGKKYIDENKDTLIKLINDKDPRTSLDIQDLSKKVIELRKEDEKFIPIKEYVYSKGLIFDHVIMALSIYLRDMALAEWSSKPKTK